MSAVIDHGLLAPLESRTRMPQRDPWTQPVIQFTHGQAMARRRNSMTFTVSRQKPKTIAAPNTQATMVAGKGVIKMVALLKSLSGLGIDLAMEIATDGF